MNTGTKKLNSTFPLLKMRGAVIFFLLLRIATLLTFAIAAIKPPPPLPPNAAQRTGCHTKCKDQNPPNQEYCSQGPRYGCTYDCMDDCMNPKFYTFAHKKACTHPRSDQKECKPPIS
ncbi:uncharacterized protein LOC117169473 [Belonocnema kinseyi]|uniref:uncharacterized protein LOC117169473 n=1 Tax=Belonocnema kinseyi TaxID=2817044 RepID=UPI00143DC71C|nr:uncharacterized protein LOC117169473 [Belonocnema kinseyi]